jgi:Flp pilus assembly protein CpaB
VRGRLLSTREGTIALGIGAAALAGLIVFAYVKQYRATVNESAAPVNVLVARSLIEAGTPGDVVGQKEQFQITSVPKDELKVGAIRDPASLQGRYATADIFPGTQLTVAAFGGLTGATLGTQLVDAERAVAVPVEGPAGLIGAVQGGDKVDILVAIDGNSGPVVRTLLQNVYVLVPPVPAAGGIGGGTGGGNLTLRVTSRQAARLAFASQHGKLWLVLRPRSGATASQPSVVTTEQILAGR